MTPPKPAPIYNGQNPKENTMTAVFFNTGGGDIYGGSTREEVIAAMKADMGDDFIESDVVEVSANTKMQESDEDDKPTGNLVTLADEFTEGIGAYCVATDNC